MSNIIILSGKSGHGKDALGGLMRAKLEAAGYHCMTVHYADLVKYYATQYYNWDGIKDEKGRALLQHLGTDKVRTRFPNYWADTISKFLLATATDFDYVFIPDARFPNEIEVVKQDNPHVITIRIERYNDDGTPYTNPAFTKKQLAHASETSLDDYYGFDYIVENSGPDLTMLNDAADTILNDLGILKMGE